jgi:O-antigen/teichoic acid export membrane protein
VATDVSEPRPLTGGAVMSAASRIVVAGTGAATTILIARLLGPDGSGGYFLAQSVVLLLTVVCTFGVEHGIAYYVSTAEWAPRAAFRSALAMAAGVGTIVAVLGILARLAVPSAFSDLSTWLVVVTCAGLPFALIWFYTGFVALAIDRYEPYALLPALQAALAMVLACVGAVAVGLEGAVVGMTMATVGVGMGAAVWALRRLPAVDGRSPGGQLGRAVTFGIKGYAANALQLLNYRLDLFVLSAAASAAAVGQYSVAVAVTGVLWLLPQAVSDIVFPRVAHLSARGHEGHDHREMVETKSVRHVVIAVVAGALVLAGALLWLVVPVYGEEFEPAIELGLILLPGACCLGVANVLSSTIVGRGRPVYSLYTAVLTTPFTVALYFLLIPRWEATGAALASTVSYAATFLITCAYYRRTTGRAVLPLLVPSRGEWDDLRLLPRAAVAWARDRRG